MNGENVGPSFGGFLVHPQNKRTNSQVTQVFLLILKRLESLFEAIVSYLASFFLLIVKKGGVENLIVLLGCPVGS